MVGSRGFWSCLFVGPAGCEMGTQGWYKYKVQYKVVAIPHSGDVIAENVSLNLKNSLDLPGGCR